MRATIVEMIINGTDKVFNESAELSEYPLLPST